MRPTSDRAREALFSMLGDVGGLDVLDLYAGTGALAIEAVSRGAARAVAVDTDPDVVRANVEALGLGERVEVVRADALAFLRGDRGRYGLILCDPPYRLAARLGPDLDQLLPPRLLPGGRLAVECPAREPLDLRFAEPWRERRYGEALIRIFEGPR